MKKITRLLKVCLLGALFLPAITVAAQDYEDDLYYSPSRERQKEQARRQADEAKRLAAGLGASDNYTAESSRPLTMDVDAYNRRNATAAPTQYDGGQAGNFSYTHRIERFHNPDVVSGSNDTTLIDYYYSTPTTQDINVYVINNVDPVGSFWNWPTYSYWNWGYPSLSFGWNSWYGWNFGFNLGFYDPFWGPSWGYRPWWGPAWGPGWNWGPTWGPSWSWHPVAPVRPGYDRPGASRPHNPSYGSGNSYRPGSSVRPGTVSNRPGVNGGSASGNFRPGSRPGNFGRPADSYNGSAGYPAARPGVGSSSGSSGSNNDRRGGYNRGSSGSSSGSSSSGRNNSYSSPSRGSSGSSGSYNRGSSGSSRGSGSSGSRGSSGGSRGGGSGSRGGGRR